ncbi:flagellar biosynthetic protein FliO [Paraburkholderia sp. ZP32-5]|uniref:flagellar biosynthetic protein FliO n=1 Tax=Paraburkholderia sp. ZP32-5 TaxID=2883245 RepID=UPI001F45F42E|nr:flagellar biosynthetic protein FliO [Paraburkholderia sp. ZP32-5]
MKRLAVRDALVASRDVLRVALRAALTVSATAALYAPVAAHAADINAVNNAAKIASAVGAGSAVPALGFGAVLQTVVGLAVVIGLVFGCAWLARRFGLQPGQRGGLVRTVGGASLGGKERVAVVEIGDTWLVLGAAPGNVRLLHTMPAGSATAEAAAGSQAPLSGTFGQRFRDAMKGEVGKRFNARGGGER